MVSQPMPPSNCLNCGKSLDAATGIHGGTPAAGCLSICIYCGAVTMYGADLRLRPMTEAEIKDLQKDVETVNLLKRATSLIHFYKAARN